jgi:hypothetical protein
MSADAKVVGYCRACGKALDESTVRPAQGTIFCEEHVPAAPAAAEPSPYTSPAPSLAPPPVPNSDVSPGLAFLLGFIPGVGAIYNGQYAKGLVHVLVLGILFSITMSPDVGGIMPILVLSIIGFWVYMPFEAYHSAKRRQLGQPLDEFSSLFPSPPGTSRIPVGPVVLIVLGIMFLLNNLGILELRRVFRYWPVILIVLGVNKLYHRLAGQRSQGDQP